MQIVCLREARPKLCVQYNIYIVCKKEGGKRGDPYLFYFITDVQRTITIVTGQPKCVRRDL